VYKYIENYHLAVANICIKTFKIKDIKEKGKGVMRRSEFSLQHGKYWPISRPAVGQGRLGVWAFGRLGVSTVLAPGKRKPWIWVQGFTG